MSAHDALQRGIGKAFDVLASQFMPNSTATLLKVAENEDAYDTVLELDSKWFFEYSNYRKNFLLEIADDSSELTAAMAEATHVQIDGDVYQIIDGDTVPPKGVDVTWKVYCDQYEQRAQYSNLEV